MKQSVISLLHRDMEHLLLKDYISRTRSTCLHFVEQPRVGVRWEWYFCWNSHASILHTLFMACIYFSIITCIFRPPYSVFFLLFFVPISFAPFLCLFRFIIPSHFPYVSRSLFFPSTPLYLYTGMLHIDRLTGRVVSVYKNHEITGSITGTSILGIFLSD